MMKLVVPALVAATALAMSTGAQAKTYTCSNPAICIAVCGKPTCGQAFASKAQTQEQSVKPKLSVSGRTQR
jgi:hypothetical protein